METQMETNTSECAACARRQQDIRLLVEALAMVMGLLNPDDRDRYLAMELAKRAVDVE